MSQNSIKDAEEKIKRHIQTGEGKLDKATVSEPLRNFGHNSESSTISKILEGLNSTNDSGFQSTLPEVDSSKNEKCEDKHDSMDIEVLNSQETCVIEDSSDSEPDYTNFVSVTPGNVVHLTTENDSSSPLETEISVQDYTSTPVRNKSSGPQLDIEIFEENNNDHKENSDTDDSIQNHSSFTADLINKLQAVESTQERDNSELNNNDDFHDEDTSCATKLRQEAFQICSLLTRFKFSTVYNTLQKNSFAINRVELSLWDLLPNKRPKVKLSKRKHIDDNCITECKRTPTKAFPSKFDTTSKPNCNNLSKQHPKSVIAKTKAENSTSFVPNRSQKNDYNDNTKSSFETYLEHQNLSKNDITSNNGILKPAKLIVQQSQPVECSTSVQGQAPFVLTPPKLVYTSDQNRDKLSNNTLPKKNKHKPHSTGQKNNITSLVAENGIKDLQQQNINTILCHLQQQSNRKKDALVNAQINVVNNSVFTGINAVPQKENVTMTVDFTTQSSNTTSSSVTEELDINQSFDAGSLAAVREKNVIPQNHPTASNNVETNKIDIDQYFPRPYSTAEMKQILAKYSASFPRVSKKSNYRPVPEPLRTLPRKEPKPISFLRTDEPPENVVPNDLEPPLEEPLFPYPTPPNNSHLLTSTPSNLEPEIRKEHGAIKKTIILPPEFVEIYNKLMAMFPGVDTCYIKKLCYDHSKIEGHPDVHLESLIEILLQDGEKHMSTVNVEEIHEDQTYDENERVKYLSEIFPDADPIYLRKIVKRMGCESDAMVNFIQSQWANPTYLTRTEKRERVKISEQQLQYTMNFKVKEFLDIFPDPFEHFENPNRVCKFDQDALEFLKKEYKWLKVETITMEYEAHKYHLTQTAAALQGKPRDIQNIRYIQPLPSQHIPLLQECAFILHKQKIKKYLESEKEREAKECEELKKRNDLWECQCCYDSECLPSKCSQCDEGHVFCNSCIIKGTEAVLGQGDTRVGCFANCKGEINLSVLQKILSPTQFSILLNKRQEAEVKAAELEGLVSCPFCPFASIPPPEDKVFKCLNPECMKVSCRRCQKLNHIPLKCKDFMDAKKDKARILLEERMTEALVRQCCRCGKSYFKEDGCNKIACACGAVMCYICDKEITAYDHFRGQGSSNMDRCPLWSDNNLINTEVVRQVAEATVKHIQRNDPEVEVNVHGLLRHIPHARRFSTDPVTNDDTLPERLNRLTKFNE